MHLSSAAAGNHGFKLLTTRHLPVLEEARRESQTSESGLDETDLARITLEDQVESSCRTPDADPNSDGCRKRRSSNSRQKRSLSLTNGTRSPRDLKIHAQVRSDHRDAADKFTSTSSRNGHKSRSNSLYEPRSIRLTRRRGSEDSQPQSVPSLEEQFAQLQDCRYLRGRGSFAQTEDS